jgi:hypothetical protein
VVGSGYAQSRAENARMQIEWTGSALKAGSYAGNDATFWFKAHST